MQLSIQTYNKFERKLLISAIAILLLSIAAGIYFAFYYIFALPFVFLGIVWALLDWKSFFFLFVAMIPISFSVHLIGNSLATTLPDEQMMWFFLLLTTFLLAARKKVMPEWFLRHPITLILALQYIWLIIAVIFSEKFFPSFKFLLAKTWYLNAFLIIPLMIFKTKEDFIRAYRLFMIPFMLLMVFIFIRHGFMKFNFWASNKVVIPFFQNHVDHSTVLSMSFPLLLIGFQLSKGNKTWRRIFIVFILFCLVATAVAQARAAMLAIIFCFVIWFALNKKLINWLMPMFFALIITVLSILVYNNNYLVLRPDFKKTESQPSFSELMKATIAGRDMSSMERLYRWIASVNMSNDRPITGVGPNNFNDYYKNYAVSEFRTYVWRNEERSTTHNYFLYMLVEQGYPAMLLYGLFIMSVFAYAQKIYHKAKDFFYKKCILGLTMVFAAGFVNNFFSELIETDKIGALFYMSVSLLIIIGHLIKKQNESQFTPAIVVSEK